MDQTEIAWAAGFFDGEGSIFVNHQKRVKHSPEKGRIGRPEYDIHSPVMSISQVELEPLDRFARIVEGRSPTGPYKPRSEKSRPYYRWDSCGRPSVHRILCLLWPYLSEPKKRQSRAVWAELELLKQPKSPKLPLLPIGD